jgi:hypothetical protein
MLKATEDEATSAVLYAGAGVRSDVQAGLELGHAIGERAVAWAQAGGTWEELDAAEEKVLALGARVLDREDYESKDFRVYADPAGHPFCLCRIEQP